MSDKRWRAILLPRGDNDLERQKKVRDKYRQMQRAKVSEQLKKDQYQQWLIDAVESGE